MDKEYASDSDPDGDFVPADEKESDDGDSDYEDEDGLNTDLSNKRKSTRHSSTEEVKTKRQRIMEISDGTSTTLKEQKDKMDALWAEFNEAPTISEPKSSNHVQKDTSQIKNDKEPKLESEAILPQRVSSQKMVTITKTYEFAGDIITETREVPEDSEEAREFFAAREKADLKQIKVDEKKAILDQSGVSSTSSKLSTLSTLSGPTSRKRPKSNLNELALSLTKKPTKINTLEKSKLDWKKYVDKEGIVDELKYHNKSGYVDKQEFLQRTYQRQEAEMKSLRQKKK